MLTAAAPRAIDQARRLSVGCLFSDRVEALLDGRAGIDGYDLDVAIVEAQRLFRAVLRDGAFDVAELSMASHIAAVAAGRRDYLGIPVFPSRSFRHANLYVRSDRGIDQPADLAGRCIGVIEFQQTAALWVRGILAEDHGVDRATVRWIAAGLHAPVLQDRAPLTVAPSISVERVGSTLDAMLRSGEIDAIISPSAPRCFADPDVPVRRMWAAPCSEELAWWERTGIFPIMHVIVVRRALCDADPALAGKVFAAFDTARALAAADLANRDFPKIMLPWLGEHATTAWRTLGGDPWSYGADANRRCLETMLRYAREDGTVGPDLTIDELFS